MHILDLPDINQFIHATVNSRSGHDRGVGELGVGECDKVDEWDELEELDYGVQSLLSQFLCGNCLCYEFRRV